MRFRLFKPGRTPWLPALGLGSLAWFGLEACSGKPFTTGGASGSSGSSSGGTSAGTGGETESEAGESGSPEGGSGGEAPNGGRGGSTPNTGGGGKPATGCDCGAGEYCRDGTSNCQKCADFSRVEFATPQKLSTLSQSPSSERFARPATGSSLFYVSGAVDDSKILYASSPASGGGIPVTLPTQVESGVLFVSGFNDQNLFFDRRQSGRRKLRMALWTAPAVLAKDALLPEPINTADSDDYSIAISPNSGHVYWMSTRNGTPELFFQPTSMSAPPAPAVLDLKIKAGAAQCARSGEDATPWVNLTGTVLLFRNPSLDESCEPIDAGATDLFAAPLNSDGTPKAAATALASLNNVGGMSKETDPTLSSDACTIYFASDGGTGDFDLYKASRN
jgi:hypothetical protein